MTLQKKMTVAAVVALTIILPLVVIGMSIEDWSRDLTTNVAWTDPEAEDPTLRPMEFVGSKQELSDLFEELDQSKKHWSQLQPPTALPENSPVRGMTAQPEGETPFHFVRTTGLMRYQDDVWVVAEPIGKETEERIRWRLHVHSQSRLGKGDLGQNPRNLRELLRALRDNN